MSDLHWLTAGEAARAITAGEVSPVELTKALLACIEKLDPMLNVFIRLDADAALAAATAAEQEIAAGRPRGPLHGVPVGIKDIIDVAGLPTTCHSKSLIDNIAAADASCRPPSSRSAGPVSLCPGRPRGTHGTPRTIPAARPRGPGRAWRRGCFPWRSAATPAAACATRPVPAALSG